jgi:hypothetical protein
MLLGRSSLQTSPACENCPELVDMFGSRTLRTAAIALVLYGILGLCTAVAMVVVGSITFSRVATLQASLERERGNLVTALHTAASMLGNTANVTGSFQGSIDGARSSADTASRLANDTAGTFREMAGNMNVSFLGLQPLVGLAPQFTHGADQLQQLAISLGSTRDALAANKSNIQNVTTDLRLLQAQIDAVATSLEQPGVLGLDSQTLVPFQIAVLGICLLVVLQSAFSIVAGIALYRVQRALGSEYLFPLLARPPLPPASPPLRTATTTVATDDERGPARA